MNLRRKTLFILGLTLLGAVALILGLSYTVLIGSYAGFEEMNARDSVIQGLNVISYERSSIESKCGEWSRWDETYRFVKHENPFYVEQNLNQESFDNLGMDLLLFVTLNRSVAYATGYNSSTHQTHDLNNRDITTLLSTSALFSHDTPVSSRSGFLILNASPVLVVSQPVLKSTYDGPIAGYVIFGKNMDPVEIQKISRIISRPVSILPAQSNI